MNLKTYLFDKSTIKSDIKRFWWVPSILMLLLALFVLPNAIYSPTGTYIRYRTDEGLLALVFGFFLAGMIFSYLHKGNAVSFLHGLPMTRTVHFISHLLAGLILLYVPIIISGIVIGCEGLYYAGNIHLALKYMYTCGIYATLTFMITAFAMLISGNTIAAYLFSFGFIILPAFAVEMTESILIRNLFGFWHYMRNLLDYIYLGTINRVCTLNSLLYIVLIIVLFVLCIWLYRIRRLENYDELVAFKPLKIVFMYTVAICFGYFGYQLLYSIIDMNVLFLGPLPLGYAALIAAFMLNKKSFNLRGIFKHIVIFTAIVGAVKLTLAYDLTGYERRMPDIDEIESIEPYNEYLWTYNQFYCEDYDAPEYLDAVPVKAEITDKTDMEDILKLHSSIIERGREKEKEPYYSGESIQLTYHLKNGRKLERYYSIDIRDYEDCIGPYFENPNYKLANYPVANDREKTINYVNYIGSLTTGTEFQLQHIDYDRLLDAVKKDIEALDFEGVKAIKYSYCGEYINVNFSEDVEYNGETYTYERGQRIDLNRHFKNTIALIREELPKYEDELIGSDDIKGVYIGIDAYNDPDNSNKIKYKNTANIVDKSKTMAILAALRHNAEYVDEAIEDNEYHEIQCTFTTDSDTKYSWDICKPYNEIPPELREFITDTDNGVPADDFPGTKSDRAWMQ